MQKNLYLMLIILFAACSSDKSKLIEKIEKSEQSLSEDSLALNYKKGEAMVKLYTEYAGAYKDDTLSGEYYFRAGDISNGMGKYKEAIEFYRKSSLVKGYKRQPTALFLQGFIYENQLNDKANASRIYKSFLTEYPDHALVNDVKFSLDNIDKSPEELISEFEKQDVIRQDDTVNVMK